MNDQIETDKTDRRFIELKWREGSRADAGDGNPYETNSLAGIWWLRGYEMSQAMRHQAFGLAQLRDWIYENESVYGAISTLPSTRSVLAEISRRIDVCSPPPPSRRTPNPAYVGR